MCFLIKILIKTLLYLEMEKYPELMKYESMRKLKFNLQPQGDVYLNAGGISAGYEFTRIGNNSQIKYYWGYLAADTYNISDPIYIFLTRASTSDRLREIGARIVLGASHNDIRRQIIFESTLITLLSLIPASFVIDPGISFINSTLGRIL